MGVEMVVTGAHTPCPNPPPNEVVDWLTMWRQVDQANKRLDLAV